MFTSALLIANCTTLQLLRIIQIFFKKLGSLHLVSVFAQTVTDPLKADNLQTLVGFLNLEVTVSMPNPRNYTRDAGKTEVGLMSEDNGYNRNKKKEPL